MTLSELKSNLTAVEDKIAEIYKTGQEYTINGSHSVENPELKGLRQERKYWVKRIALYRGYNTSRSRPDFN